MTIGQLLLEQRIARGWTQAYVAEKSGYCVYTVQKCEHDDNVTLAALQAVAGCYKLEVKIGIA